MNVSEVIYNAWKNTEKPIIYELTDAKGNCVRKEIDFADPEQNKFYDPDYEGKCNMCGEYTHGGIPIKKMFSSNYMDWAIHKSPESTHICKACGFCIGMNPNGRIALFRYPVVAGGKLHLCSKKLFRDFLLDPPEPPFAMILPKSQKKHLFGKSKVSYSKDTFFCNLEENTIQVNGSIRRIIEKIEALRGIGFSKDNITDGVIPGNVFKNYGFKSCEKLMKIVNETRLDEQFELALEVAQKKEMEEAECYLDLTQRTK